MLFLFEFGRLKPLYGHTLENLYILHNVLMVMVGLALHQIKLHEAFTGNT